MTTEAPRDSTENAKSVVKRLQYQKREKTNNSP